MMKTLRIFAAAIAVTLAAATAQETGVPSGQVTHSYVGHVTAMEPAKRTITVAEHADANPVAFVYSENTRIIDAEGNRADPNTITTTTLVRIDYTLTGDVQNIRSIVVNPDIPAAPLPPAVPQTPAIQ